MIPEKKPIKGITLLNSAADGASKAIVLAVSMRGEFTVTDGISSVQEMEVTDGKMYNLACQLVDKTYKVIRNGKKIVVK